MLSWGHMYRIMRASLMPTPLSLSEQCPEESSNALLFCGRDYMYSLYTYLLSKEYLNIMSYSDSSPFYTEKHTVLGMSNANCCRTLSVLPYEKHLNTRTKASFYFWCSARVPMVNGARVVVQGHPKPLLWSHSAWLSWRRGWVLIQQHHYCPVRKRGLFYPPSLLTVVLEAGIILSLMAI